MRIGTLTNHFSTYSYQAERDYEAISDRFLRNTLKAIDYLYKTKILTISFNGIDGVKHVDIINVLIADTKNTISIVSGPENAYNATLNTVIFLDTHGAVFRKDYKKKWFQSNKGYNSPLALLCHELIHCYNELYQPKDYHERKEDHSPRNEKVDFDGRDLSFPNAEEAFVIKMTNQVAERLGEDKRSNYGRSYYAVADVFSTEKKRK